MERESCTIEVFPKAKSVNLDLTHTINPLETCDTLLHSCPDFYHTRWQRQKMQHGNDPFEPHIDLRW